MVPTLPALPAVVLPRAITWICSDCSRKQAASLPWKPMMLRCVHTCVHMEVLCCLVFFLSLVFCWYKYQCLKMVEWRLGVIVWTEFPLHVQNLQIDWDIVLRRWRLGMDLKGPWTLTTRARTFKSHDPFFSENYFLPSFVVPLLPADEELTLKGWLRLLRTITFWHCPLEQWGNITSSCCVISFVWILTPTSSVVCMLWSWIVVSWFW